MDKLLILSRRNKNSGILNDKCGRPEFQTMTSDSPHPITPQYYDLQFYLHLYTELYRKGEGLIPG